MKKIISVLFIVVAIIHLLPVSGVLGSEYLFSLYGLPLKETDISILMRHRAVMFGLLGLFLVYAAFKPAFQPLAFIAGFVSVISFIVLAWSTGDYNEEINRVIFADVFAFICLLLAGILYIIKTKKNIHRDI